MECWGYLGWDEVFCAHESGEAQELNQFSSSRPGREEGELTGANRVVVLAPIELEGEEEER